MSLPLHVVALAPEPLSYLSEGDSGMRTLLGFLGILGVFVVVLGIGIVMDRSARA